MRLAASAARRQPSMHSNLQRLKVLAPAQKLLRQDKDKRAPWECVNLCEIWAYLSAVWHEDVDTHKVHLKNISMYVEGT